jgi:hypothetical protein
MSGLDKEKGAYFHDSRASNENHTVVDKIWILGCKGCGNSSTLLTSVRIKRAFQLQRTIETPTTIALSHFRYCMRSASWVVYRFVSYFVWGASE